MLDQVSQLSLACCTELLHYRRTHKCHHDSDSAQPPLYQYRDSDSNQQKLDFLVPF
jgi:hypothetical protein